jgi:hypothetical protein
MCSVGNHICLSGTTDVVAAIPADALPEPDAADVAQIQASKWMIERLVGGLFSLGRKPPVTCILPVQSPAGTLLGMLQQDCTLRLVDLQRQQQVASLQLDPADRQQYPSHAKALPSNDPSMSLLVVELQKDLVKPSRSIVLAGLTITAAGRASLEGKRELQLAASSAKLQDVVMDGHRLLALLTEEGRNRVAAFDASDGRFLSDAALLGSTGLAASAASAAVVHLVRCLLQQRLEVCLLDTASCGSSHVHLP